MTAIVCLHPSTQIDLQYVLSLGQDALNYSFIMPRVFTQFNVFIQFADIGHFIIESGVVLGTVGFVVAGTLSAGLKIMQCSGSYRFDTLLSPSTLYAEFAAPSTAGLELFK